MLLENVGPGCLKFSLEIKSQRYDVIRKSSGQKKVAPIYMKLISFFFILIYPLLLIHLPSSFPSKYFQIVLAMH